jgi:hypothetical protein
MKIFWTENQYMNLSPPDPSYNGTEALYSPHDINSIYRVYGKRLGADYSHEA